MQIILKKNKEEKLCVCLTLLEKTNHEIVFNYYTSLHTWINICM